MTVAATRAPEVLGRAATADPLTAERTEDAIRLKLRGQDFLRYHLRPPAGGGGAPISAGFFHPLATPRGTVVTAIGSEGQPHLRGAFMAWGAVDGRRKGDFWGGPGRPAAATSRIVNRSATVRPPVLGATNAQVVNEWRVGDTVLVQEEFRFTTFLWQSATVVDIAVRLTVDAPVTLGRMALGGFAVQTRTDGTLSALGPTGPVSLPPSRENDPRSLWPDAPWYGLHCRFKDGKEATMVVVGRARNPATTWHVVPAKGLVNPCLTAARPLVLSPDQPTLLRYRLVAADGPPQAAMLTELGDGYYRAGG